MSGVKRSRVNKESGPGATERSVKEKTEKRPSAVTTWSWLVTWTRAVPAEREPIWKGVRKVGGLRGRGICPPDSVA